MFKKRRIIFAVTEKAAAAISFDRILIVGLLFALVVILVFSVVLVWITWSDDSKIGENVIMFYKDLALILAGALANSVRHAPGGKSGTGSGNAE